MSPLPAQSASLDVGRFTLMSLGFAALQPPRGSAMDVFGSKRVMSSLQVSPGAQLRANVWMLMPGSVGMIASTVPVHSLIPVCGWRGVFEVLAVALAVSIVRIYLLASADPVETDPAVGCPGGYREILQHPQFRRLAPFGLFSEGGVSAVRALRSGPCLTRVSGWTADDAARGLLGISSACWWPFGRGGSVTVALARRGVLAGRLMAWGAPFALLVPLSIVMLGSRASAWNWALW